MTLITTEIHVQKEICKSIIFMAADRCMSRRGKHAGIARKIFPISNLKAGIGFFGIAEILINKQWKSMSPWLQNFIAKNYNVGSMRSLARLLKKELDKNIPNDVKRKYPSGFHLTGFNSEGYPEFWFVTNIGGMKGTAYTNLKDYFSISEDFLRRDLGKLGYDGIKPTIPAIKNQCYRHGDTRAHIIVWEKFDRILMEFFSLPDFKPIKSVKGYEDLLRFKMQLIARIYKKWCRVSLISTPIDVFSITNKT